MKDDPAKPAREAFRRLVRKAYAPPEIKSVQLAAVAFMGPSQPGRCCDTGLPPPCVPPDVPLC